MGIREVEARAVLAAGLSAANIFSVLCSRYLSSSTVHLNTRNETLISPACQVRQG